MKRIIRYVFWVQVAVLPLSLNAGEQPAAKNNGDTWSGTLTAVNAQNNTITGKHLGFSKTFNLGQQCAISAVDKKEASLNDLRPGEKVQVHYQAVDGVLVTDCIAERALHYSGTVHRVDQGARTVTLEQAALYQPFRSPRSFRLAEDCKVSLANGRNGTMADLHPGDRISIVYELPDRSPVAYRISNKSATFVGAIGGIDLSARTMEAKEKSAQKKFDISDHCRVVLGNEKKGKLKDLMVGQRYLFTYQEVNGVNVLDRVAPVPATKGPETASVK